MDGTDPTLLFHWRRCLPQKKTKHQSLSDNHIITKRTKTLKMSFTASMKFFYETQGLVFIEKL